MAILYVHNFPFLKAFIRMILYTSYLVTYLLQNNNAYIKCMYGSIIDRY